MKLKKIYVCIKYMKDLDIYYAFIEVLDGESIIRFFPTATIIDIRVFADKKEAEKFSEIKKADATVLWV